MPFIKRPQWIVYIDGVRRRAGLVTLNMALGDSLTTVAEIELIDPAITSPAVASTVELSYGDRDAAESWPVFKGTVQQPMGSSYPNRLAVRCNGPLSLLRDIWDSDFDFTGATDGDVIETVLTSAGIVFDTALIQDAGLTVGTVQNVVVPKEERKSAIVSELNRILSMVLVEIGFDIHRFYVDRVPVAADIVRTFTRGADVDFWGNDRTRGPIDGISNYWNVTGVTYDCGPPAAPTSCRCTIFANSVSINPALGTGVRTERAGESSDLIQDQDFAEWIAGERIRVSNRIPDYLTLVTSFDPEIHVGHVVGVQDNARGIDLSGAAVDTPYLIERIDVDNFRMILELRGASVGFGSSVTSGNEERCNQTTSPGPPVGAGFVPPAPWPVIIVVPDPWNPCDIPPVPLDCTELAFAVGQAIEPGYDWQITGTVELTANGQRLTIGVNTAGGAYTITIAGHAYYSALMLLPQIYEVNGPGEYRHADGAAELNRPISYVISWDHSAATLTGFIQIDGDICYDSIIEFDPGALVTPETVRTVTGSPIRTLETMLFDCGYVVSPPPPPGPPAGPYTGWDWSASSTGAGGDVTSSGLDRTWDMNDATEVAFLFMVSDPLYEGSAGGPYDVRVSADFHFGGSEDYALILIFSGAGGFNCRTTLEGTNYQVNDVTESAQPQTAVHTFGSHGPITDTASPIGSFSPASSIHVQITMRQSTGEVEVKFIQGATVYTYSHTDASDWQSAGTPEIYRLTVGFDADNSAPGAGNTDELDMTVLTITNPSVEIL